MTGALAPTLDAMPREKDVYFAKLAEQAEREELSWAGRAGARLSAVVNISFFPHLPRERRFQQDFPETKEERNE